MHDDWAARIEAIWDDDALSDESRVERIDAVAAERPVGDPVALFERAGARDAAGLEADAAPLYRAALDAGLDDVHRPQAVIQLASTLRNLGRAEEAVRMLRAELSREPASPLHDEAAAFSGSGAGVARARAGGGIPRPANPRPAPQPLHALGRRVRR